MRTITLGIVSAFLLGAASIAMSAEPNELQDIVALALDDTIPVLDRTREAVEDEETVTVVFAKEDRLYGVEVRLSTASESPSIRFFVPAGDGADLSSIDSFADWDGDGTVDYGAMYDESRYFELVSADDPEDVSVGLEHAGYWQRRYDDAVALAREYFTSARQAQ